MFLYEPEGNPSTPNPTDTRHSVARAAKNAKNKVLNFLKFFNVINSFYSIIGSYTIRSNSKYIAVVSVHEAKELCVFNITLKGPSYKDTRIVKVHPMTTEYVEFDVPIIKEGDYKIKAKGLQGIIFRKSCPLEFQEYEPIVLIQMDKATYKPGDLVQFRAVFVDENIRPIIMDKPINITISDAQKNRLKQWKDVQLKNGVYVGKFQLSEQPLLGDWIIDVTVEGQTLKTKIFEVDKYVLPKFSVSVESKDVAIHDGVVNVTVRSVYTYGQGVKGKAVVSIRPKYYYFYEDNKNMQAEKTIDVNGKGQVQFKIGDDILIERDMNTFLEINAVMEEELTGNKMEASTSVQLHSQRFCFEGIDNPYEFHPGNPLTLKVAVKTFDFMPVLNSKSPLKLTIEKTRHYYCGIEEEENKKEEEDNVLAELVSDLDEHGIAIFEYTFSDTAEYYYLKCQYLECESHFTTLSKYREPEPDYHVVYEPLTVTVLTENPKLNKTVEVEVKTSDPIPYFIYTIHARGKHLKTEFVTLPENTKRHVINITPSFEMIPCTSIFVHYVVGFDLRYQNTSISFERDSENFIDITAPTDVSPGEEVTLDIKSNPESYIGLMGVDQSVLLLKSGNDLDMNDVFNTLERFDNSTSWRSRKARCPGDNSGLITLTNANYPVYESRRGAFRSSDKCRRSCRSRSREASRELVMCDISDMPCEDEEQSAPMPRIRKQFLESWLFEDFDSLSTSSIVLKRAIPDTITSWVITGFSLNPKTGLAITKNPSIIKTFRPFFVGTNLPYSIKRGEQITIPVIVFNYMEHDLKADITLDNSDDEYDFREPGSDTTKRTKNITVASNTGENVNFSICPKKIGNITLKITAVSPIAGDAIHKELKVEPEGISVFKNRDYYLHTDAGVVDVKNTVQLDIPKNVVPDSEFIEVTVMGNILSSTITNIDNLVRMPCGCGEQIMVNFVPNILILWYLESIQELTTTIEEKAKRFLEIGYQSELTYKHDDGSYSAFGKSDSFGSTWLTAYVIRCFHQAKKYIDIDSKILEEGLNFLAKTQAPNGCFPENGHVFDSSHMNEVGLTAFVLLTFLENKESMAKHQDTIDRGFDYLQQNLRNTEDVYALSVAVYALQQRNLDVVHEILAKLETLARIDGGLKYWAKEEKQKPETEYCWYVPSHDVEITGYILMTLLDMNMPVLPITRWLISQRNSNGGYGSTQDTVVGLWALIKFAEKNGATNPDMSIEFTTPAGEQPIKTFLVNKNNSMITQGIELPKDTRQITFAGKGTGTAVLQISYRYNISEKEKKPSFKLSTKMKPKTSAAIMYMDIVTEFIPEDSAKNNTSNMVVMEVSLPSGYTAVTQSLDKIKEVEKVKRVETKDDDTSIVVYFDNLEISDEKCIPIEAELSHVVAGQKPVPIVIYDYYDSQKRATEFYEIENSLMEE